MRSTMYQICIRGRLTGRLGSALEGDAPRGWCDRNDVQLVKCVTSQSFTDSSTRSVVSALSLSAYNRSPRVTRRPTTRRRIDIDPVKRSARDRLPHIADGSIWIFTEKA